MGYQFATSVYINEPTFAKEFASIFCGLGLFLWFPNFIFINLKCFKSPVQEMPRVLADRSFGSLCPRVEAVEPLIGRNCALGTVRELAGYQTSPREMKRL